MKPEDTIEFTLAAEETIVNDTVKITAQINGMISRNTTEQQLRDSIRALMRKFIATDDWQYANTTRNSDPSGQERITLIATTRVHENENYALDRRREEASRDSEMVNIASVQTDTTPPQRQIEETQSRLRLALLTKARNELALINAATGEDYRLGSVLFRDSLGANVSNAPRGGIIASAASLYGSGFGDDDTIGNAVKLSMQATVQLRISRA